MIFVSYLDLGHQPREGVKDLKRAGDKTFMLLLFILLQSVHLLESWLPAPARDLLSSAVVRCSQSLPFCHAVWNEDGSCLPISFDPLN